MYFVLLRVYWSSQDFSSSSFSVGLIFNKIMQHNSMELIIEISFSQFKKGCGNCWIAREAENRGDGNRFKAPYTHTGAICSSFFIWHNILFRCSVRSPQGQCSAMNYMLGCLVFSLGEKNPSAIHPTKCYPSRTYFIPKRQTVYPSQDINLVPALYQSVLRSKLNFWSPRCPSLTSKITDSFLFLS